MAIAFIMVALAANLFVDADAHDLKWLCLNSMSSAGLQGLVPYLDLEITGLLKGLSFEELVGLNKTGAGWVNASTELVVHQHAAARVHDLHVEPLGSDVTKPTHRVRPVTIVSGSHTERKWSKSVKANHEAYARSQGYHYKYVNMTDWTSFSANKEPQWLKVLALLQTLSTTESEHVLWVDDDVVFTSDDDFVNAMIEDMQDKSLLIARDIRLDQINTGMMLFRRGRDATRILKSMWRASDSTLGYCKDQSCFHEQEALNNLIGRGDACARVVDPVNALYNVKTMWRRSHYDERRKSKSRRGTNMYLDYDETDPPSQRWHWGMNTAHVSGMTPSCRAPMLEWLVEYARRFVFGSERNQSSFRGSNPYTIQCREHLGPRARRGVLAQGSTLRNGTNSTQMSLSRKSTWDNFLASFSAFTPMERTIDEPHDIVSEISERSGPNTTESGLLGPGVGSLAEIISSFLPDLLGADAPQVTRVDISVNYTSASESRHSTELVVNLVGQLVASNEGTYDFIEESSNSSVLISGNTTAAGREQLRMRSGKAALSVGGRDLSLEFVERRHGAGLVFDFSWDDEAHDTDTSQSVGDVMIGPGLEDASTHV